MKYIFIILSLGLISGKAQPISFGGVFQYGSSSDKEPTGILYAYPLSDTTYIIYLEVNIGPPSFNTGSLLSKIVLRNEGKSDYEFIYEEEGVYCKLKFTFSTDYVNIQSNISNCGFGHGVNADGIYKRIDPYPPNFFIDQEGKKIYFEDLRF